MSDDEKVWELLHSIDKALAEARGEVRRLMSDVKKGKADLDDVEKIASKLSITLASERIKINANEKAVERLENRSDRLLWGMIVGMATLLLSVVGLVLNAVFNP